MKRLFTILAICFGTCMLFAQEKLQFHAVNHNNDSLVRYKLYSTFNVWTFLKLDTRTGTIYQVQYTKDEGKNFQTYLGTPGFIGYESDTINGRYELYPTSNNYTRYNGIKTRRTDTSKKYISLTHYALPS